MNYPHIMSKLLNQPLLMEATALTTLVSALSSRVGIESIAIDDKTLNSEQMADVVADSRQRKRKPYSVMGSVAVIPITGTIVQKTGMMRPYSGMTGTDGIAANLGMALEDPDVDSILLDIDSPGGSVAGTFDLSDMIHDANDIKPVVAYAGELAASAAYAMAAAASKVYLPRTGAAGSIGVLTAHRSIEGKLENEGIKVTIISAGEHKVDGNPFEDLPDDVRDDIQEKINSTRDLFASSVARYRGMDVTAVLDTEARMYTGQKAVDAGLADGVMTFNQVLNMMQETDMTKNQITAEADVPEELAVVPEAIDAVAVIEMCSAAGFEQLATGFITAGMSIDDIEVTLAQADEINSLCVAAGIDSADVLMSIGNPVDLTRTLLEQREPEIDATHSAEVVADKVVGISTAAIWAKRRAESAKNH